MKKAWLCSALLGLGVHAAFILWLVERSASGTLGVVAAVYITGGVVSGLLLVEAWILDTIYPPSRPDIWELDVSWQLRLASITWWPLLLLANFLGIYPQHRAAVRA